MLRPTISPDEYPKIRSALAFQLLMTPSSPLVRIASLDASTRAARWASRSSAGIAGPGSPRGTFRFSSIGFENRAVRRGEPTRGRKDRIREVSADDAGRRGV